MEHWDELCPGGLRIVYDGAAFRPGTDSFLLSSLPRLRPGLRVCDLGCGTGLLGLLLLQREPELTLTGVELQPEAARLAALAAEKNGLRDRMTVLEGDLRGHRDLLPAGSFDLAVCNPPYYPTGRGRPAAGEARRRARGETDCTLEDVCRAAAWALRWGGAFCLCHKPERLTDLLWAAREAGLEPKRLRPACRRPELRPALLLLEARRGGKPGLEILPPLIMEREDGGPTEELDRIYFRDRNPASPHPNA